MKKILVLGAGGQIGSELVPALRKKHGAANVIAAGHSKPLPQDLQDGPHTMVDVRDKDGLKNILKEYNITVIYNLASLLSATGEENPNLAWDVNMNGLKNVLDLAVELELEQVFWPSSIAVFGPHAPRENTPQHTVLEPTTMYGVTKVAGELLCNYYHMKHGLDVRSIRYPGLISYKTPPGGGTTDYAVAIFHEAIKHMKYACFVRRDTILPMMYMDDAIRGTIDLMDAPKIGIRTSYNFAAISFSAEELAAEIRKHIPEFSCTYEPDHRQAIADSWPQVIDDSAAREEWSWRHEFDLKKMTEVMLQGLR